MWDIEMGSDCPFCRKIGSGDVLFSNGMAVAIPDGFPLNPGHALVVPKRHVRDFFDLSQTEQEGIWSLVPLVRSHIDEQHSPSGYNLGLNIGESAGQTVDHAHLHIIPRYKGDVSDPRGGVRWVLPERAAYWLKNREAGSRRTDPVS